LYKLAVNIATIPKQATSEQSMSLKHIIFGAFFLLPFTAGAQERHPAMEKPWSINLGSYFSERNLKASANITIGELDRQFDFEKAARLDDSSDLLMGELGWQFSDNWGVALQIFRSQRHRSWTLDESIEWQGNIYDVGARVDADAHMEITRVFFARRFHDNGPHSLRIGAGIHWLDLGVTISGQATLDDQSKEFRRSVASASLPVPNIGTWYRYSPNDRWMINARIDWLSASIDKYSGDIWNVSAGVNFSVWDHFGVGASYQYFNLAGTLKEENWRGAIETTFTGPYLYVSGFW
jgi:opacity protein-like surface antigen